MALNLYLDDRANSDLLAELLTQAGHTVVRPADVGLAGEDDDVHLGHAVQHGLIVITKDPDDLYELHLQNPNHHGIFGIYQDNDVARDMSNADVVAAIGKIEAAVPHGYPLASVFHKLNLWR